MQTSVCEIGIACNWHVVEINYWQHKGLPPLKQFSFLSIVYFIPIILRGNGPLKCRIYHPLRMIPP